MKNLKRLLPLLLALFVLGLPTQAKALPASCYDYTILDNFENSWPDWVLQNNRVGYQYIQDTYDASHAASYNRELYFHIGASGNASSYYLYAEKVFNVADAGPAVYWIPRLAGCPAPVVRAANPSTNPDTCYVTAKVWASSNAVFDVALMDKSVSPWVYVARTGAVFYPASSGYVNVTAPILAGAACKKTMSVIIEQYAINNLLQNSWVDDVQVHWGYSN